MSKHIKSITRMMRRVLNTLDYHLMDHGDRVAYLVLQMYKNDESVSQEQLSKICYLCMFHDIGAYFTESLDSLSDKSEHYRFELKDTAPHSTYSYIFFHEYKCFEDYADALLYHHFPYQLLIKSDCKNIKFASRLFLADKIDMLIERSPALSPKEIIAKLKNPTVCTEQIELLERLEKQEMTLTKAIQNSYHDELMTYLKKVEEEDELESFIYIVPHAIDFKSEHTVTHTIATVEISLVLAKLFDFNDFEMEQIYYGSLLHDIGKVSVSQLVLEKNSTLTEDEFRYMRDHVTLSAHILKDCVSDEVYKIAVRHHEKLDGSGYPNGLKLDNLTVAERIVAVADVMSALLGKRSYKEPFTASQAIPILEKLRDSNQLCEKAVNMAIENYDLIDEKVKKCSEDAMLRYKFIKEMAKNLITKATIFS